MALKKKTVRNANQGDPGSFGAYTYSQLEDLWIKNGGDPARANIAAAVALAESSGRPNATDYDNNGTVDRGLWQINSVHGSLSSFDVNLNTQAAINISNNGQNWTPWVTYNTGAYKAYLDGNSPEQTSSSNLPTGSSSGSGNGGGFSLIQVLTDIVTLNIRDLAAELALAGVFIIKEIAIGIGDYVIRPAWHWNQRTVAYYEKYVLFGDNSGVAMVATASFWGLGYWLFFSDPNQVKPSKPIPAQFTRAANGLRSIQSVPARRNLVKPKDIERHTPKKPKPSKSRAQITQIGVMSTTRPQRVSISDYRQRRISELESRNVSKNSEAQNVTNSQQTNNGQETDIATVKLRKVAIANENHSTGRVSLQSSGRIVERNSSKGRSERSKTGHWRVSRDVRNRINGR